MPVLPQQPRSHYLAGAFLPNFGRQRAKSDGFAFATGSPESADAWDEGDARLSAPPSPLLISVFRNRNTHGTRPALPLT